MKTSCFAYRETVWHDNIPKSSCMVLTKHLCEYGKCPFYKTYEQFKRDAERAKKR